MQESCIMNKRFLVVAIASTLISPFAANAADAKFYGRAHLTMDHVEQGSASASSTDTGLDFNSRKSAIGFKGKEKLGDGMAVFFKMEWEVDMDDGAAGGGAGLTTFDRYVGIKTNGMGVMKMGTLTTSYKETSKWVDPFWHTIAEGRADLSIQSGLAGGLGIDRGRATDTFQYRSPKMGGMQMVLNRSYSGNDIGENTGVGFRYTSKTIKAFIEYVSLNNSSAFSNVAANDGETASKVGVRYKAGDLTIGLQLEQTEDLTNADYSMFSATYKVTDSGTVLLSAGTKAAVDAAGDDDKDNSNSSFALGYNHGFSKRTNMYVAYAAKSDDDTTGSDDDLSIISLGIKHTF